MSLLLFCYYYDYVNDIQQDENRIIQIRDLHKFVADDIIECWKIEKEI